MLPIEASQPEAAYIHVPFCRHRCGYCNFTLVAGRDDLTESYLEAIERELASLETPREVRTLYLGGGTPTFLAPAQLERLFETVLRWHPLADGGELTIEANPHDLDDERARLLGRWSVTRCSLGGQSLNPRKLRVLERDHAPHDIVRSVERLRAIGASVALDLIFAVPGETLDDWQRDIEAGIALEPDHVSTYGLTFEKGTAFWSRREKGLVNEASEELARGMYAYTIDRLAAAGFEHYEISNFARPGCRSRHNQVYWCGEPYYAAGPGAARYLNGCRETNHRSTTTWLRRILAGQSPVAERDVLVPRDRARELLVLGLRRLEGVRRDDFERRTGMELEALAGAAIRKYVACGLLADDGCRVRLTRDGIFLSDSLWPDFL